MINYLLVGLGGALGSMLRFGIGQVFGSKITTGFPLSTFLINIIGCLLIGVILGIITKYQLSSFNIRLFLAVGFCGGFTTFSAFSNETLQLLQSDNISLAIIYVLLSVIFGIFLTYLGYYFFK